MKKTILILSCLALVIFISSFTKDENNYSKNSIIAEVMTTVPTEEESIFLEYKNIPFVGKMYNGFREAIAFKESQGKYGVVNSLGYMGKYQFGRATLERFNIYDTKRFLQTPELQEDAFLALCSVNKWILRKDINRSVGKKIDGITITESGILAAAHLAGAGNVKKFLRSGGDFYFADAYGTSVRNYLKQFSGYDVSFVEANQNPEL
mgnify:CR=1 FL=1|jgi:hypothetical protein